MVHRIISISHDNVVLMGDGNVAGVEHCRLSDVKAVATHVVDVKGGKHDLYAPWRCRAARWWFKLLPVRRYLLAIYRRTWLNLLKH